MIFQIGPILLMRVYLDDSGGGGKGPQEPHAWYEEVEGVQKV